jgi:type IV pilus assembly protein PilW
MMNDFKYTNHCSADRLGLKGGFTLIELMVTLAVTSIITAVIYSAYNLQQRTFRRETMVVATQQNARSALFLMEKEIRMVGYDRLNTDLFGLTNITLDGAGNGTLTFTTDNGAGTAADNGTLDGDETITYAIYDALSTVGNSDLGRTVGGGVADLLAEGIEAMGMAYAFDDDRDGRLDTSAGGNVIWAVDSDGDNDLDLNLDSNDDGNIDAADFPLTVALATDVNIDRIRAMRVFILARTKGMDYGYTDNDTYVVGNRRITPADNFRRRLLVATVKCRNLGL